MTAPASVVAVLDDEPEMRKAPHRLLATLDDMLAVMGDRPAVVCRELTKIHEEFRRAPLSLLIDHFTALPPKGEVVILLTPAETVATVEMPDPLVLLRGCLENEGLSVKDAVKQVTAATGLHRSEVYRLALQLKETAET